MLKLDPEQQKMFAGALSEWLSEIHGTHWTKAHKLAGSSVENRYDDHLPPPLLAAIKADVRVFTGKVPEPSGNFKSALDMVGQTYEPDAMTVGSLIFLPGGADLSKIKEYSSVDNNLCHELVHACQYYMLGAYTPGKAQTLHDAVLTAYGLSYIPNYIDKYINAKQSRKDYESVTFEHPACMIENNYAAKKKGDPKLKSQVRASLELMKLKIKN